ncbi:DHHA2 domain-containing protein, partial [Candidatus Oleimmundimicrobium sp.]|uniref:DHHA2 domain-containing protein n=1 Tax=Candidatus Oleimmundimicrobium sp. TaxID=3060597 RepID=UPI002722E0D1
CKDKEIDLLLMMITDIIKVGTELLVTGRTRLVERGFGVKLEGGSVFLSGVISRKKQVAPVLARMM